MRRRQFLTRATLGLSGCLAATNLGRVGYAYPALAPPAGSQKNATRNTAKNLIFVFLAGGASHVDTFDLKLSRETPNLLGAQNLGGFQWPAGIMPQLAKIPQKFSLVRSLTAVEAVHERAQYHLTTSHRHDASRVKEVPHMLAAMSAQLYQSRRATDTLPPVLFFGDSIAKNGFFPIEHRGLTLEENGQIPFLTHELAEERASARFNMLRDLLPPEGRLQDRRNDRVRIHNIATRMMNDQELLRLLQSDEPTGEPAAEGNPELQAFAAQCRAAVKLLNTDKGTRLIRLQVADWDHHFGIYQPTALPTTAAALDYGLAYLINTLESLPAKRGSGSLLDETLIVVAGEFGRTTDGLNESAGRDHYPYVMSALFAGGGVKPGRVIGSSDPTGSFITDQGWRHGRHMGIGDLAATMYSALGIDWAQRYTNTPSGRMYELVPTVRNGPAFEIDSLFA